MAANARGIKAGLAYVELVLHKGQFDRGLRMAQQQLLSMGASLRGIGLKMAGIGLAVLGPLAASGKVFASMGGSLNDMANRTGMSVEALSELSYAAEMSGTNIEQVEKSFKKTQNVIDGAAKGLSSATDSLKSVNVNVKELKDLSPDEQFMLIADRISAIKDPAKRAAAAMDILGGSGTALLPMLKDGANGIRRYRQEAREFGVVMSEEDANAAASLGNAIQRLWKVINFGIANIGNVMAPSLEKAANAITNMSVQVNKFISAHKGLITTIAKIAAAVVGMGGAFIAIGSILTVAGKALGGFTIISKAIKTAFAAIAAVISGLLTPFGLIIAAVVTLGVVFLSQAKGIGGVVEWLKDKFTELSAHTQKIVGAIANALARGDIASAAKILWLTLKMEWERGTNFLISVWSKFKTMMLEVFNGVVFGILATWESVTYGLQYAWVTVIGGLKSGWASFVGWYKQTTEALAGWLVKKWYGIQKALGANVDMDFVNSYVDESVGDRIKEIEAERNAAIDDANQQKKDRQSAATREYESSMDAIGGAYNAESERLQSEHANRMSQIEAELSAAKKELADAIAASEAKNKEESQKAGGKGAPGAVDDIADKTSVMGTFGAFALAGLGANKAADRTANACEETARNTKQMISEFRNGGTAFA